MVILKLSAQCKGGAFALAKWVDFDSNPDFDEIDTKHPGWVGAWWISTGMMII